MLPYYKQTNLFAKICCNLYLQKSKTSSCFDSRVSMEWVGPKYRPLPVCPRKKLPCVLATKSWQQLTYISLIVGDPQGILDQQLRPRPIHLLNIIITYIIYIIKYIILRTEDHPNQIWKQNSIYKSMFVNKLVGSTLVEHSPHHSEV